MNTNLPQVVPSPGAGPRDRWEYAAFRCAFGMFATLPPAVALRLGAGFGSLAYRLAGRQRRVALWNLKLAFPDRTDSARREILDRSCRNLGRLAAEFCQLNRLTPDTAKRYVHIEDPALWRRALARARERGTVVLTGHFGNWELFAYAHALFGHPVSLVHRPMRNPLVDRAVKAVRERPGTRSLAKKAAAREVVRALRRKELVVIPADQNQTRRFGVFVDFFGLPASTTPGPARLALLTGAPILPVFLVRDGEAGHHRVVILPEIEVARSGDRAADILTTTQRCTHVIEGMIRRHPDHWIWFHKRWRTRPPGEPRLYP